MRQAAANRVFGVSLLRGRTAERTDSPPRSDFLFFPVAALKKSHADGCNRAFRRNDRQVRAAGLQVHRNRQEIRQWNFKHPEAKEIYDRRRQRITGSVERLQHHHRVGVADVSAADDAQATGRERNHRWVMSE